MSLWSRIERRIGALANELLPDEFREKLSLVQDDLSAGKYRQAKARLSPLLEERPEDESARVLLGWCELYLGELERSREIFDALLESSDDLSDALLGRGEIALREGDTEKAIALFRRVIPLAGGESALLSLAYRGLGVAFGKQGDHNKAVRELRKAVAEDPKNGQAIADLGEALRRDSSQSNEEARRSLEALAAGDHVPAVVWNTLCNIALEEGRAEGALRFAERGLAEDLDADTRAALLRARAEAQLDLEEWDEAATSLEEALSHGRENAQSLALRARLLRAKGKPAEAMDLYERSLFQDERLEVAKGALALALAEGDITRGVEFANRVLAVEPDNPSAMTARAVALAASGDSKAARATAEQVVGEREYFEALILLAELDEGASAKEFLRRALRVASTDRELGRAREIFAKKAAHELGVSLHEEASWYDLALAMEELCRRHPELSDLREPAGQLVKEYDEPLLVAIMGEFSSGKSSLVNAFVGAEVAPTGVLPTTATINIVKYGQSTGARIVYLDGHTREIPTNSEEEARAELAGIDDHEARRIRHVELLLPIAELASVNIIDTPGLNSILPEHEAVARAFLKRADAVVWVFTASQAGKSTERKAIDSVREEGVRVLGVLNKADQLEPKQIKEILAYVDKELGTVLEKVVTVSALQALQDRESGGWPDLRSALERHFFDRAREIKVQALVRRIARILPELHGKSESLRGKADQEAQKLLGADGRARDLQSSYIDSFVQKERMLVSKAGAEIYRSAAKEVLALVRPRQNPFGANRATAPDRDYLVSMLDSGYESLMRESETRVREELRGYLSQIFEEAELAAASLPEARRLLDHHQRLIDAQVYGATLGYLRGFLRGGFVDKFFQESLPKLSLSEDSIFHTLFRSAPEVDELLIVPLARAGCDFLQELAEAISSAGRERQWEGDRLDAGLRDAVDTLQRHFSRLSLQNDDQETQTTGQNTSGEDSEPGSADSGSADSGD